MAERSSLDNEWRQINRYIFPDATSLDHTDPNYPGDDELAITINLLDPHNGHDIAHSHEGVSIRGFFLTEYRAPNEPPTFE